MFNYVKLTSYNAEVFLRLLVFCWIYLGINACPLSVFIVQWNNFININKIIAVDMRAIAAMKSELN